MVTFPRFYGGSALCSFLMFANVVPLYGSSFLLVAISFDRYTAVCRPLASMSTNKVRPFPRPLPCMNLLSLEHTRAHLLAAGAWAAAILVSTPQLAIFRLTQSPYGDMCVATHKVSSPSPPPVAARNARPPRGCSRAGWATCTCSGSRVSPGSSPPSSPPASTPPSARRSHPPPPCWTEAEGRQVWRSLGGGGEEEEAEEARGQRQPSIYHRWKANPTLPGLVHQARKHQVP